MKFKLLVTTSVFIIAANAYAADQAPQPKKWQPQVELEGRTNKDRSLLSPKLLIPLSQTEDSMLFTDIRTRFDDHEGEEYNLGLGFRKIYGEWIYGGYGFIDHMNSSNNFNYWQGTAGLEALSAEWEARVNAYIPESEVNVISSAAPGLVIGGGGNFGISSGSTLRERALPGIDAEIGYKLPVKNIDLRVFAGGYYFDASDFEDVAGPKARAELTIGHEHLNLLPQGMEFTLGVQYQNDGPREDTTTALMQIRMPLGGSNSPARPPLTALEKRMATFIERDVDIVAGTDATAASATEAAEVDINGQDYTGIDLTVDSNTAGLVSAVAAAGNNSFVVFDGSAGSISVPDEIVPQNGQVLVGAGTFLTFTGVTSGKTVSAALPGTRPSLSATSTVNSMIGNSTGPISNFSIIGMDLNGANQAGHGLDLAGVGGGGSNIYVNDLNISNVTADGLRISTGASNVSVNNSSVTNAGTGLIFDTNVTNSSASNITINDSDIGVLISTSNHLSLTDVTINDTADLGVLISGGDTVSFNDLVINNADTGFNIATGTNVTGNATMTNVNIPCNVGGTLTGSSITINGTPGACP